MSAAAVAAAAVAMPAKPAHPSQTTPPPTENREVMSASVAKSKL
jgi:hypothetical protein